MFGASCITAFDTFVIKLVTASTNASGLPLPFKKLSNAAFIDFVEPWIVCAASLAVLSITPNLLAYCSNTSSIWSDVNSSTESTIYPHDCAASKNPSLVPFIPKFKLSI